MLLKETEEKVKDYIKSIVDADSKTSISISDISEGIGLSTATVHRSLHRLQDLDVIKVIRTKARNHPDTIMFLGDFDEDYYLLANLQKLTDEAGKLVKDLTKRMVNKQREFDALKKKFDEYQSPIGGNKHGRRSESSFLQREVGTGGDENIVSLYLEE